MDIKGHCYKGKPVVVFADYLQLALINIIDIVYDLEVSKTLAQLVQRS